MAVIDSTRSHASPLAVIGQVFNRLAGKFSVWKDARATHKALSQLSDRELADIGINRGDIDYIVRSH
ncbi:hypothetical protein MNBD_ALPHA07-203 [hydrothermal vent metagenome]|uniref:YjiS-like domain-containing protein n=1 Tax=hydrothermal vent metagenome TaxID=652676 RepID=A0A3B0SVZ6_9ZZZZ